MQTIRLGRSGPLVPPLALGTLDFGTRVERAVAVGILDAALDLGATLLDSANNYAFWAPGGTGDESETVIGGWLVARPGARDRVTIASKIGARPRPGSAGFDDMLGLSAGAVRGQVDDSLRRLRVDHLDILYAHIDDTRVPMEETVGALQDEVTRGTARYIACSNVTAPRLAEALVAAGDGPRYVAAQQRFSYLKPRDDAHFFPQQLVDEDLEALTVEEGVALLGFTSLLGGAYSRSGRQVPETYRTERTEEQLRALAEVAAATGLDAGQAVLAWMVQRAVHVIPVVGVSSVDQLRSAVDAVSTVLPPAALSLLARARGDVG
jgi:aryl-alcohol dehydrogenase-like predicted oxidoreductase